MSEINTVEEAIPVVMREFGYEWKPEAGYWQEPGGGKPIYLVEARSMCLGLNVMAGIWKKDTPMQVNLWIGDKSKNALLKADTTSTADGSTIQEAALIATARALRAEK